MPADGGPAATLQLLDLPHDVLVCMVMSSCLRPSDLCNLEATCRSMAAAVASDAVWRRAFLQLRQGNVLRPPASYKSELRRRQVWARSWREQLQGTASASTGGSPQLRGACRSATLMQGHCQGQRKLRRLALKMLPGACGSGFSQYANTLVVDPSRPEAGCFRSIGSAVACAKPFDQVLVAPGTYRERLDLDKGIDIIGMGGVGEVVLATTDGPVVQVSCKVACRVASLCIRQLAPEVPGPMSGAVRIDSGGVLVLEECTVTSDVGHCIVVKGVETYACVMHNTVCGAKGVGVLVCDHARGFIEDNDISRNRRAGVAILSGADPIVRANKIHEGFDSGVLVSEKGGGRIEDNDIFANTRAGVAILKEGAPIVSQNRIYNGRDSGVLVCEHGRGSVVDNQIYANQMAGVAIGHGGVSLVRGNTIRDGVGGSLLCLSTLSQGLIKANIIDQSSLTDMQIPAALLHEVQAQNLIRHVGQVSLCTT